ncbi:hypothetical protein ACVWWP_008398 [Bradyrhizobium sp. LM3.6]
MSLALRAGRSWSDNSFQNFCTSASDFDTSAVFRSAERLEVTQKALRSS